MADFPTLSKGIDMATFGEDPKEDPSVQSGTDGGWVYSRPRYTRRVRMIFKFGYTDMTNADRVAVRDFYKDRKGGSEAFNWTHPTDGTVHLVRFSKDQKPSFPWEGIGTTKRWGIKNIVLEEV